MHKMMIWAGLAGTVALATAAIAQTPQDPNMPANSSTTTRDTTTGAYAPNATTSAADTSATSGADQGTDTAVNQAGERG